MRLWIGLALLAVCVGNNLAQSDEYDWYGLDDSNFQSQEYDVSEENKDDNLDFVKEQPGSRNENEEKVTGDKENFDKSLEKTDESILTDYQFEDNRSEPKDEQNIVDLDEQKDVLDAENPEVKSLDKQSNADYDNSPDTKLDDDNMYMDEDAVEGPLDNENKNTLTEDTLKEEESSEKETLDTVDDVLNKVFDEAKNEEKIQELIKSNKETNQFIEDLTGDLADSGEKIQNKVGKENSEEIEGETVSQHKVERLDTVDDIVNKVFDDAENAEMIQKNIESNEETNQLLKDLTGDIGNSGNENPEDDAKHNVENGSEEDAVYTDIGDDLQKLFETWEELQDDDSVKDDDDDNIIEYEDKYNKPYRESNILSAREYDDGAGDIDDDMEDDSEKGDEINNPEEIDGEVNEDAVAKQTTIGESFDEAFYRNGSSVAQKNNLDEINDEVNDDAVSAQTRINESIDESFYRNVSSVVQEIEDHKTAVASATEDQIESTTETYTNYDTDKSTVKSIDIDDLTPGQYDDLMKQFSYVHSEDLEIKSGDHVAPIHISLSADEAVVIESPDYPDNYPTNNVIDYYFDGLGAGIEFNITDFSVNGILGDYLLVKPGGIDASGADGLVFSYHLKGKRQYRFLNVDRLFVRFFAHPGIAMFKGYQFSIKMISPPEEKEEVEPEPEPLLPPIAVHTVNLGGTSLEDFAAIEEDFRRLIADMATMYINANDIDGGLNSTSDITQITRTSLCNVNWPGYESCVAVTFGVPLEYDDGEPPRLNHTDLETMWETYAGINPFAARLKIMGISDFDTPNDQQVLTIWLVLAAGVLISVAMLAFALWRYSCFEDYTRMATYSDADSINEKKVLDMHPTPHQTFPSLYSEQQLKWDDDKFDDTTRVDMGGYANKSYLRDDALDMDSDEDIITTPRDRNTISPRDIYEV